jgi:hypothetical protein
MGLNRFGIMLFSVVYCSLIVAMEFYSSCAAAASCNSALFVEGELCGEGG